MLRVLCAKIRRLILPMRSREFEPSLIAFAITGSPKTGIKKLELPKKPRLGGNSVSELLFKSRFLVEWSMAERSLIGQFNSHHRNKDNIICRGPLQVTTIEGKRKQYCKATSRSTSSVIFMEIT